MRVMTLLSTLFFEKCLRVDDYGSGRRHPCHISSFFLFCLFSFIFPVVPKEGFSSNFWHFLGIFTCNFLVSLLVILHIVF